MVSPDIAFRKYLDQVELNERTWNWVSLVVVLRAVGDLMSREYARCKGQKGLEL